MIGIYKIISPSGKVYVGQSFNIERRFKSYKNINCKNQIKLYNSFKKYGSDKHIFEIILLCNKEDLNFFEGTFQEIYNSVECGLNCKLVDKNSEKYRYYTENDKCNLSIKAIGKKHSTITKIKISNTMKAIMTDEMRKSRSESSKGRKFSIETINKLKKISKTKFTKEYRKKLSESHLNKHFYINLENGFIFTSVELKNLYNGSQSSYYKNLSDNKNKSWINRYKKLKNN